MELLSATHFCQASQTLKKLLPVCRVIAALWLAGLWVSPAQAATSEYQVKAAFLFNFSQFVEWPVAAFADAQAPLVIGIIGEDPFGHFLDDLVRGEKVGGHPLVIQRYQKLDELKTCHILFVGPNQTGRMEKLIAGLKGRSILTVGDAEDFARQGGMIRFVTEKNKIRFMINLEAAKAASLIISSKLLRPAEIVSTGKG